MDDASLGAPPDLLAMTQAGCRASARALFRETSEDLLRFCRWMGLEDSSSSDVVQDIFESAMKGELPYKPHLGSPLKFLLGVARFKVLNRLRLGTRYECFDSDEHEQPCEESPELLFSKKQTGEVVKRALLKLSTAHREALVLCEFQGLDYLDASEILGVPLGTLRSRLFRARSCLRNLLAMERY